LGRTRRVATAVDAALGRRVGRLAWLASNGVVAAHHVFIGGSNLVALTRVLAGVTWQSLLCP